MYKDFSLCKLMRLNKLLAFAVRMEVLNKLKKNRYILIILGVTTQKH